MKKLADLVAAEVQKKLEGTTCGGVEVNKNGVCKYGVFIRRTGARLSAIIYFGDPTGYTTSELADYIVSRYEKRNLAVEQDAERFAAAMESGKEQNIVFQVMNAERNAKLLENLPHFQVLDLAVSYIIPAGDENCTGRKRSYVRVTDEMMKTLGMTEHTLYETALKNTPEYYQFSIKSLYEIMIDD